MTLSPGSRLGSYDVTALIGQGGMGEVYRARDTKLNRALALKVLPEAFATDRIGSLGSSGKRKARDPRLDRQHFRNSTPAARRHLLEMRHGRKTY